MKRWELFAQSLEEHASSKTRRYFLKEVIENKELSISTATFADIVKTTELLRSRIHSSSVIEDENGGMWNVREYEVPSFLAKYINLSKLYLNDFYAKRDSALLEETVIIPTEGKIVNPSLFNYFWYRFNENQSQFKIPMESLVERKFLLNDVESVLSDVNVLKYVGGSVISREVVLFAMESTFDFVGSVNDVLPTDQEIKEAVFEGSSNHNGGNAYGGTEEHGEDSVSHT